MPRDKAGNQKELLVPSLVPIVKLLVTPVFLSLQQVKNVCGKKGLSAALANI